MQVITYKVIPEPPKNTITFSKNYRIFSTGEPVPGALNIVGFDEDLDLGSASSANIIRKMRYSSDRGNWSLWYPFSPADLSELAVLDFGDAPVFIEVKYEYDDTTYNQITTPLTVNSVKFRLNSTYIAESLFTPTVYCSSERCPAIIAEREASFKPYEVGTAIGIAKELSFQTNKLFGHEVVYFKTEPDRDGGDFIFKEWTLFKTTDRKCVKVVVPNNTFPDNKPNFTEFGVDFEIPFEIHIDHIYFQSIFGPDTQPRKRDYMYFPLTNRMYEIQGSYLFRGFMMEPLYWKIQLTKFSPNIDMLMKTEDRRFLDNIIMSSDELFGKPAEVQKKDALDKKQYKTISHKFDETRRSIHPDLSNKILDYTFNYAPLIEYYYDMSGVKPAIVNYSVVSNGTSADQELTPSQPYTIYAYQDSEIYKAWTARRLNTGDSTISSSGKPLPVKMNGPKDSYNPATGKYVAVEGYKNLGFNASDRRDITEFSAGVFQFKQSENAVVYKSVASTVNTPNMTFSALVKFNKGTQSIKLIDGFDNFQEKGMTVTCNLVDIDGIDATTTVYVNINGTNYTFPVGPLKYDKWYSVIIPVSAQYGQLEVNIYSFGQDPANVKNYNRLISVYSNSVKTGQFSFETTENWTLPSANYSIANIRLFNTMVQEEDHEFIVSQLFIRDESLLEIIDNARPRLNVPFIAINL
jgi:hypothetical protein